MRRTTRYLAVIVGAMLLAVGAAAADLTPKERLGKLLFFDSNLSTPGKMSCATCHDPSAGYADPRGKYPTSQGVVPTRFGNRNTPQSAYAMGGPQKLKKYNGGYAGGKFWDGRSDDLADQAKAPFCNPLEMNNPNKKQVVTKVQKSLYASEFRAVYGRGVFTNANYAYDCIADAISEYEKSSEMNPCSSKLDAVMEGKAQLEPMERMGMMVFHGKGQCSQCHYSGKAMGRTCAGGCACGCAYTGVCKCADCDCGCPTKGEVACEGGCMCGCSDTGVCNCGPGCQCGCLQTNANACAGGCACGCAFTGVCNCGPMCQCGCPNEAQACEGGCQCGCAWTGICNCEGAGCGCGCAGGGMMGDKPLFTNHGYFNLGIPRNPNNPFYTISRQFNPLGRLWTDPGLGGALFEQRRPGSWCELGKMKVPSLRNCAKTAPYMHNGVFPDLKTVVQFYNTRDVRGAGWPRPEVNHPNIFRGGGFGNMGLTDSEVDALVAFLKTMTDGYSPPL